MDGRRPSVVNALAISAAFHQVCRARYRPTTGDCPGLHCLTQVANGVRVRGPVLAVEFGRQALRVSPTMTVNVLIVAGGLLAAVVVGAMIRARRTRANRITTDQLSGDWLAHARSREDQPW